MRFNYLNVFFEDDDLEKLSFDSSSTGGVPLFVSKWEELMSLFDKVDEINKTRKEVGEEDPDLENEYDDAMANVITAVEFYLCLTYKLTNFSITNVIRKEKKE